MADKKNGRGQKYPVSLFCQTLKNEGGEATTTELTDEIGCSNETTRLKMHELQDDGIVESREIGTVLVWRFANRR